MDFVKYRKFHDQKFADELISILQQNNIEYEVSELKPSLDSSFRGSNPLATEIIVKIKKSDFDKMDKIWENDLRIDLDSVDKNHYIFEFNDEELFDVLSRPDEWSPLDYKLSIALLKRKGKEIDEELLRSLKKQRINDLSKAESSQVPWIMLGYFVSFLGGILGVAIGWHLTASKKILPDGTKVHSYTDSDRKHGKIILYLGIASMLFWISLKILSDII